MRARNANPVMTEAFATDRPNAGLPKCFHTLAGKHTGLALETSFTATTLSAESKKIGRQMNVLAEDGCSTNDYYPKVVFQANDFISHIISIKRVPSKDFSSFKMQSISLDEFNLRFKKDQKLLRIKNHKKKEAKRTQAKQ